LDGRRSRFHRDSRKFAGLNEPRCGCTEGRSPGMLFVIVDQTAEAANETGSFRVAIASGVAHAYERRGSVCTGVRGFKECDEELSKSRSHA
jgi:hypothetical protein